MLRRLLRMLRRRIRMTDSGTKRFTAEAHTSPAERVSPHLDANLGAAEARRRRCDDVVIRQLRLGRDRALPAFLVFVEGLADKDAIARDIIDPLLKAIHIGRRPGEFIRQSVLAAPNLKEATTWTHVPEAVLAGETGFSSRGNR